MSKISSLNFIALDISGKNYLSWILDAEINLEATKSWRNHKRRKSKVHVGPCKNTNFPSTPSPLGS